MAEPVRIGFVGLGWWGRTLAAATRRSGAAAVAVGCAGGGEARDKFAAEYGCPTVSEVDAVLADPAVDAVVLATPHTTHADLAVRAAQAGKHVFVEKPLALDVAGARRAVDAAAAAGVVLQVGHNRRFQTANRRIKQMIEAGELGVVHQLEANFSGPTAFGWPAGAWRQRTAEMPGGGLTVMGVHMVDTMHYLVGTPELVFGRSKRILSLTDVDEATGALLEFASGPIGYLGTSVVIPNVVGLAVFGSEAAVWNEEDGTRLFRQVRGEKTRTEQPVQPNDTLAEELAEFARCARTGEPPEVDGAAGLAAVATMAAIVDSARTGAPVRL